MKPLFQSFFLLLSLCLTVSARAATEIDTTHMADLPVAELQYDASLFNTKAYIPATLTIHSADSTHQYDCSIRHRGGTALLLSKPSFAIKMLSKKGNPKDVRLFDMRKDNNWILDAMAADLARMRNRVSFDLWLDFSRRPYHTDSVPKAINGSRGRFVEVYANGEYMGLYDLMERIDRKQLKLKKFDLEEDSITTTLRGILYKAYMHGRTTKMLWQQEKPDNSSPIYDGMEAEYPDLSAGEPFDWNILRDNIYFMAAFKDDTFVKNMPKRFDLPVFIDYMLFIDLLLAEDNISKNYYCWYYDITTDHRLGITPWDMDATWGRNYLRTRVSAQTDLPDKGNLHARMSAYYPGYQDSLNVRWAELRETWFDETSLQNRFDSLFDWFAETGVKEREAERWHNVNDINLRFEEQDYIHQWIHDRLEFLDGKYGYEAPVTIGQLSANADTPCCYDLMGRRQKPSRAQLQKGFYIVGRQKVLVQ